jgi:hypothetical protein
MASHAGDPVLFTSDDNGSAQDCRNTSGADPDDGIDSTSRQAGPDRRRATYVLRSRLNAAPPPWAAHVRRGPAHEPGHRRCALRQRATGPTAAHKGRGEVGETKLA